MEEVRPYWVVSPEYDIRVPVLDFGEGPMEPTCDVMGVLALDENDAKVRAIRAMRKNPECHWINDDPGENPFAGLEVRLAVCDHGTWQFTEADEMGEAEPAPFCNKCQNEADWEWENEF